MDVLRSAPANISEINMSNLIQTVGSSDFDTTIQSGVVLVDFYADWCGPCRRQLPVLEEIATKFEGKAKIIKVDTDKAQDIALRFGIQSIPTLVLLKNGKEVTKFVGLQQAETLKAALEKAIETP